MYFLLPYDTSAKHLLSFKIYFPILRCKNTVFIFQNKIKFVRSANKYHSSEFYLHKLHIINACYFYFCF